MKIQYGQQTLRTHVCAPQDLTYNFQQIDEFMQLMDYPVLPTSEDIANSLPTVEPPRGTVRFQLTTTFDGTSKVAEAKVIASDGADLDPGEVFDLYDGLGRYVGDALGTERGVAQQRRQPDGSLAWEPISLGGLGSAIASDNYTVKADAGDASPDFLDGKFANFGTYNAGTDQLISFQVFDSGGNDHKLLAFFTPSAAVDNYTVKVDADDTTPQYLHASFVDQAVVAYDSALHSVVHFAVIASGGERQIRAFTAKNSESGRLRTTGTDVLDFLHAKWLNAASYSAGRDDLAYFELVGGKERCFTRDPRVSCGVGDLAEFLPDQFVDLTVDPYSDSDHVAVKVVKETVGPDTDLRLYLPKASIQSSVGIARVRVHTTVPARDASGPGVGSGNIITLDGDRHYVEGDSVTLLNDSWSPVVVPSEPEELVLQARPESDGAYTILGPLQLEGLDGFSQAPNYGQSVGHNKEGNPKWQDDGLC